MQEFEKHSEEAESKMNEAKVKCEKGIKLLAGPTAGVHHLFDKPRQINFPLKSSMEMPLKTPGWDKTPGQMKFNEKYIQTLNSFKKLKITQ